MFLGLVYLTWAVWFFSNYQRLHERQRQEIASNAQQAPEENVDWRCNVLAAFFNAECQPKNELAEEASQHAQVDLHAQQDMAEWTLIVALISVPGLIVSGLGLWALYWTFREQRNLAQNQEMAILEVEDGAFWPIMIHSTEHLHIEVAVRNVGRTAAKNVRLRGTITLNPDHELLDEVEVHCRPIGPVISETAAASLQMIPPNALDVLASVAPSSIDTNPFVGRTFGSAGPNMMCPDASLEFSGVVDFEDVFGRPQQTSFYFQTFSVWGSAPFHFDRTARHWRASAYHERALEFEERIMRRVKDAAVPKKTAE